MASHANCDHPATKAGRAACRRGAQSTPKAPAAPRTGATKGATRKERLKRTEGASQITTMPHDFAPLEGRPIICKHCGQTEKGRLHDGVRGESMLDRFREACKHPSETWVLKGQTKAKAGTWYCTCGKIMGDNGPRDLSARLRF